MSNYVLSFRSQADRTASADEEAAWGAWFQQIGSCIVDFGGRVGRVSSLGNTAGDAGANPAVLSGYITIQADDLESAVGVAKGCPGLTQGGGVEVGEIVDMT
jgi:hypothetical protein